MHDLLKAMKQRCSRRKYLPQSMNAASVEILKTLIADINSNEKLKIELILDNGTAFQGLRRSYGMFSGVRNYMVLIGDKTDSIELERLGYYGELLVLHATALGLGTCWVGGTYDPSCCPVELKDNESIVCSIVIGNTAPELSTKERFLRWGTHRKSKTIDQMYVAKGTVPDWFLAGMKAVQMAPSAVNRQPVTFSYQQDAVTAFIAGDSDAGMALDLGIAKLHFELGAGGGKWTFGNQKTFDRNEQKE